MLLLLLSALFALISGASAAECKIIQCSDPMRQSLNLTVSQPWSYPERFREEIELYYKSGDTSTGLRKLCKAFRDFRACAGDNYRSCMTPGMVVQSGVTPKAGYEFVSVFSQLHYTCGAGLNVFLNNEQCMKTVWTTKHRELEEERIKYNQAVDSDPINTCVLADKLRNRFSTVFFGTCEKALMDVEFWGCEYARIYVFNRFPQCSGRCSTSTYSVGGIVG